MAGLYYLLTYLRVLYVLSDQVIKVSKERVDTVGRHPSNQLIKCIPPTACCWRSIKHLHLDGWMDSIPASSKQASILASFLPWNPSLPAWLASERCGEGRCVRGALPNLRTCEGQLVRTTGPPAGGSNQSRNPSRAQERAQAGGDRCEREDQRKEQTRKAKPAGEAKRKKEGRKARRTRGRERSIHNLRFLGK